MPKGSSFERAIAKILSEWWTDDRADDVLWRSQNSGARATTREKTGQTTTGQYGDLAATDPIALPLTELAVWELKVGYSTKTPFDVFDRSDSKAQQLWEEFFFKTIRTQEKARTFGWAVISKRNYREPAIFMSRNLFQALSECGAFKDRPVPNCTFAFVVRDKAKKEEKRCQAFGTLLSNFLEGVTPANWKAAHAWWVLNGLRK